MAFKDFPSKLYFKTLETSEQPVAGGLTPNQSFELEGMELVVYRKGTLGGSEQLRINLWHDFAKTSPFRSSSWVSLSSLSGFSSGSAWLGRVMFSFASVPFESGLTYYASVESSSYTRSANTTYLALAYDWPYPVNTNTLAPNYALAMGLWAEVRR